MMLEDSFYMQQVHQIQQISRIQTLEDQNDGLKKKRNQLKQELADLQRKLNESEAFHKANVICPMCGS
jgi:cell division protein FtsB